MISRSAAIAGHLRAECDIRSRKNLEMRTNARGEWRVGGASREISSGGTTNGTRESGSNRLGHRKNLDRGTAERRGSRTVQAG